MSGIQPRHRVVIVGGGFGGLSCARALDGSDEELWSSADVQHEALVALLTDALSALSQEEAGSQSGH